VASSLFTTTAPVQYWPGLIEAYRRYLLISEHTPIVTLHEGQKTDVFEVVDALGDAPDWLCIPVGNAGNISAYWMGFCQYHQARRCKRLPRMMGFQAAGVAPLVPGRHTVPNPETVATAIRIGNPANLGKAIAIRQSSQGSFNAVTDEEILTAYQILAAEEGIFCEPASAASVAGLLKVKNEVPSGATVVCVLTGNGLKDPEIAIKRQSAQFHQGIPATLEDVATVMGFKH
jgi:threonine synthase